MATAADKITLCLSLLERDSSNKTKEQAKSKHFYIAAGAQHMLSMQMTTADAVVDHTDTGLQQMQLKVLYQLTLEQSMEFQA